MRNQRIVSIDFGSAYTKVAIRRDWDQTAEVARHLSAAIQDEGLTFCVPSVVARVDRSTGSRWVIGREAARLQPSGVVRVYRHWKADLFSGSGPSADAREVASVFFRELRAALTDPRGPAADYPVRVCVPRLPGGREIEVMADVLRDSGWSVAAGRPVVYEPESNVCGVFTRGRNVSRAC